MQEQILFRIHGQVQHVGYRQFTHKAASQLKVTGWVRNRGDGTVECLASATPACLKEFKSLLAQGPAHSRVDHIDEQSLHQHQSFTTFQIEPTED